MPKFFYTARNKRGEKEMGSLDAHSQEEAVSRLQAKELVVVNVASETKQGAGLKPASEITGKGRSQFKHNRIANDDLILLCRQLATLLGAGVTILKSLDIISMQVSSRKLQFVIKDLQKKMEAGLSFHEAMAKHSNVFSDLWINLVESGEASGNLALVLNRLAGYLERAAEFKKKIISALIYPGILAVAGTGALLFLTIKIIPTFAELFAGFNIQLPLLTIMLIKTSEILRKYFLIFIIVSIVLFFILRKYIATREGKRAFEKTLLKIPLVGEFFRTLVVERFTSEMSTLVESGVPILFSLEIAEHSVGSVLLEDVIHNIKDEVREGKPLNQCLEKSDFFDAMAVQMVAVGEEIGELSNMFKRLNAYYEDYIDTFMVRFTALFEPLMLIFMGAVVGIMVIGVFLPIFQITQIK
ncbi:MAG: type II secretion system F family protein [Candidatus Omnitrophica bacterium]|nr:type II secretion system F family protein [Candidatus Omnitrophota bacterium]MBU1870414.1 type II secretion system F family protein [Candidatus Omnitrophota bacterium]